MIAVKGGCSEKRVLCKMGFACIGSIQMIGMGRWNLTSVFNIKPKSIIIFAAKYNYHTQLSYFTIANYRACHITYFSGLNSIGCVHSF